MTQPTALDQYMLELVNRARANPQAEADLYLNGNINKDFPYTDDDGNIIPEIPTGTNPVQPLAFNLNLNTAANGHTQWMLDNNVFSHTGEGGSSVGARATAAGYTWSGIGENIAISGSSVNTATDFVRNNHQELFDSPGHRLNIMNNDFEVIGISSLEGPFDYGSITLNSMITTQKFGYNNEGPFITGVAYTDAVNNDDFYTVGEGIGGITVTAVDQANSANTFTTTTWDTGGYRLDVEENKTYNVTFSGDLDQDGKAGDTVTYEVVVGSENVKQDVVSDSLPTPPPNVPTPGDDNLNVDGTTSVVQGLGGNDTLTGSSGGDSIGGGEGNDVVNGELGNDFLTGWTGNDELNGGSGNDTVLGGDGLDTLNGGDNPDTLKGGNNPDELNGDDGNDFLQGETGNDILNGGDGDDTAGGGIGDDTIDGGIGNDSLTGWKGNDNITGGAGNDMVKGGDGVDTLTGVDPTAAQPGNNEIDTLRGGADADLFILGDAQVYYDDNGTADYALIGTFNSAQGDRIQLSGNISDYSFNENVSGLPAGTAIYANSGSELIAVVDRVTGMNWSDTNTTGLSFV
ncbi:MAG: hemolysin [Okeania sp. SIO3I5]|uniref:CAP domain-containing protein n=1 Tax=Okeania sp. SIO3I5 TaxID=2607805 RepID=UPI0013BA3191|nr:CAP domain-containing protein [Okeania sp. SIO3I5]NEQ36025.1 hemolysin [Okeania sp. SIO3I5]